MFTCVALAALLAVSTPPGPADVPRAVPSSHRSPRIRPHDSRATSLLLQGVARSETLRLIVDRLETLHVIVYVDMQPSLSRGLAGRMVFLTATDTYRYVRVSLNPELSSDTLVAVLGHELQHALEVALAPSIVDEPSMEAYYRKHGMSMRAHANGWDTQAARDAGDLVRRELADSPAAAGTKNEELRTKNGTHN